MGAMRVLRDGDRVVVLARSLEDGDGNVFIEPWSPALLPAHRVAEPEVGPFSVRVEGWPPEPVVVDDVVVAGQHTTGRARAEVRRGTGPGQLADQEAGW
jgi:hypothetical protein